MNAASDSPHCPQCGSASSLGSVGGLCPRCLALSALNPESGWLISKPTAAAEEQLPCVPGWRITGLIGAGGMGRVYRAESDNDGTVGALKILDTHRANDEMIAVRFEAEASALRHLDHPNIVHVLDTTESEDGRFCLVMEFVDGCDLGRLLRADKLAPDRAIDIFHKVCSAVEHAHAHGFVHRDIKPGNILIGRDGTVKLVDFGLAKDITLDSAEHSLIGGLTSTTDQFGTAYYIAPERFVQRKPAGPQSDVYSLGVLLYHVLTGQMPLGRYTPLSQAAGLSPKWDAVIASALEAEPSKRTATVVELDLAATTLWREHLAGTDRAERRRLWIMRMAAASVAMLMAAAGALWQWERMRPPPPKVFAKPASATQEAPWENSLGMKFVPVPKTKVLFSIYELRRRDVVLYLETSKDVFSPPWDVKAQQRRQEALENPLFSMRRRDGTVLEIRWDDPGWPITPDHPVILITVRDMQRYCMWLTWKEIAEGRLKTGEFYRLPTHAEWLAACGGEGAELRAGNLAGSEVLEGVWSPNFPTFSDPDAFPRTAPVGSFPPERFGLYDISGNVAEWVTDADFFSSDLMLDQLARLCGPCFVDGSLATASFGYARRGHPNFRLPIAGVRLVLEYQEAKLPAKP